MSETESRITDRLSRISHQPIFVDDNKLLNKTDYRKVSQIKLPFYVQLPFIGESCIRLFGTWANANRTSFDELVRTLLMIGNQRMEFLCFKQFEPWEWERKRVRVLFHRLSWLFGKGKRESQRELRELSLCVTNTLAILCFETHFRSISSV